MQLKSKAFWSLEEPLSKEPLAIPEWDLPCLQLFVDIDVFLQLLINRARPRSISSGRWVPKSLSAQPMLSRMTRRVISRLQDDRDKRSITLIHLMILIIYTMTMSILLYATHNA